MAIQALSREAGSRKISIWERTGLMTKEAQISVPSAGHHPEWRRQTATQALNDNEVSELLSAKRLFFKKVLWLGICILLAGCGGRNSKGGPSIEFTKVPLAGHGGPERLDSIEGRVVQARPGQQ